MLQFRYCLNSDNSGNKKTYLTNLIPNTFTKGLQHLLQRAAKEVINRLHC